MDASNEKPTIILYFAAIIAAGWLLLMLPISWQGAKPLKAVDALFTATSAICVTGLTTVNTADYSRFGQWILILLMQLGGLGIIAFATSYALGMNKRISLGRRGMIRSYYIDEIDSNPRSIVKRIIINTALIESIGTGLLYLRFSGLKDGLFTAFFHAVSAFCNAGFSTFPDNLEGYVRDPFVELIIGGLIILGGLGFLVSSDIRNCLLGRKRRLSSHSAVVLAMSASLIIAGSLGFGLIEWNHALKGLSPAEKAAAAFFQAVTPRTAGFDSIAQNRFSDAGILLTMFLMLIGASPASTGGGIKTTTFFVLLALALKGPDRDGRLYLKRRAVSRGTVLKAVTLAGKCLIILLISAASVLLFERNAVSHNRIGLVEVIFECISALGTVGLSLGITAELSTASKIVLIMTMLAGRVGLFAMNMNVGRRRIGSYAELPETDLIVG